MGGENDPYYDLFEDWDLIVSSFLTQYGIRLQTKEFQTVDWDEFKALLSGLNPDTSLGRIVAIRAESDKKVIKNFNKDQRKIYNDWRKRSAKTMNKISYDNAMLELELMFKNMAG